MDVDFGGDEEENEFADLGEKEADHAKHEKDCIIFLIDAQPAMLTPGPAVAEGVAGPSPFDQALSCVADCMRDRILAGDQDVIGVVLFGTEYSKGAVDQQPFPHLFVLQEPEVPSAKAINQLQRLLITRNFEEFGAISESDKSSFEPDNLFWLMSMLFNTSPKAKGCTRRVLLITSDDDPATGCAARRERAVARAKDMREGRVRVDPFFFAPPDRSFNLAEESFWSVILSELRAKPAAGAAGQRDEALLSEVDESAEWLSKCVCEDDQALVARVRRAQHRRRTVGALDLRLGGEGDPALPVKLVSIIKPFVKAAATKIHSQTNEPLMQERTTICKVHGTVLQPSDIWKAYNFGGKYIYFEPYEIPLMEKALGPKGLQLLGFKPKDRLKFHHNLQPSVFLEPDLAREGSSAAFTALVHAMHDKCRIAMCTYRRSEHMGGMRLVALMPQLRETEANSGVTSIPCGFHMVYLPWADEVRKPNLPPPLLRDDFREDQLEAARALVREFRIPEEESLLIPNPAAQRYYSVLEGLALLTDKLAGDQTEPVDETLPDARLLGSSAAGEAARVFAAAFDLDDPSMFEPAPKRAKTSAPNSSADWLDLMQRGGLKTRTMPELKAYLKENNLALGGKKDDLVARVEAHLKEVYSVGAEKTTPLLVE